MIAIQPWKDRRIFLVGSLEPPVACWILSENFHRVHAIDDCDHDCAIVGFNCGVRDCQVAVDEVRIAHAVTRYAEREGAS